MEKQKQSGLCIDASSGNITVCLLEGNDILGNIHRHPAFFVHCISSIINELLSECKKTFNNINFILVGCGPGSYAGVKSSISFVKGVMLGNKNIEIFAINSLFSYMRKESVVLDYAKQDMCYLFDGKSKRIDLLDVHNLNLLKEDDVSITNRLHEKYMQKKWRICGIEKCKPVDFDIKNLIRFFCEDRSKYLIKNAKDLNPKYLVNFL